jgi:hypothetical protein
VRQVADLGAGTLQDLPVGLQQEVHLLLQIRFGLAPLIKLRAALGAIRRGEADRISGEYPPRPR